MTAGSARRLVGRPVRVGALDVGSVDDVVLGADLSVVLGIAVRSRAGRPCFLPWAATRLTGGGDVEAMSAATLLGELELEYYLRSGTLLTRLLGAAVGDPRASSIGAVDDVLLGPTGLVDALLVMDGHRAYRLPLEDTFVRWTQGRLLELTVSAGPPPAGKERQATEPRLAAAPAAA